MIPQCYHTYIVNSQTLLNTFRTRTMKKKDKEKETDFSSLLVFGYGCKLFRDDQKAASIEKGEHLIAWMGDSSLHIDRLHHL